ncbi:MAG: nucleotidyltransferase domain-containing protein, partial [Bacteroidota bacterium]
MKDKINLYLNQLEDQKSIKILLACETGSRAWGFPSPDSDFDIRIIYVHKTDWYLSLNDQRDSIELMLENNDLDISGWELKKSLQLLMKSNPPLLERIQSPIIYQSDEVFITDFVNVAQQCYSRIASLHHYLSMAQKMFDLIKQEEYYSLKKFFYALRSAFV